MSSNHSLKSTRPHVGIQFSLMRCTAFCMVGQQKIAFQMSWRCITTRRFRKRNWVVFITGDQAMVRDYQDHQRPWIKGVIQDRLGPITYQVMVGIWFETACGSVAILSRFKVADTEPMAETPLDDRYPVVMPLHHPELPQIESSDSQGDSTHVILPSLHGLQNLVPVSALEELPIGLLCNSCRCSSVQSRRTP